MNISIKTLTTADEMKIVEDLQRSVWIGDDIEIVPVHLLMTAADNGGTIFGAYVEEQLVGFSFGFLGINSISSTQPAKERLKYCSHMMAIHPNFQNKGIGLRLKHAQRDWAAREGIPQITWTYDPLLSRNAYLNIRRLGGVCNRYSRDYYGEMRSLHEKSLPSDRFHLDWWIDSARAKSRLPDGSRELDLAHFLDSGARMVNRAAINSDLLSVPSTKVLRLEGQLLLAEIPADFHRLQSVDLELALAWRLQTRAIFEEAFSRGYVVTDFVYPKAESVPRSYYLLTQSEETRP
jgi:predicted GNAT superfamily acetyltransferase